jgi:transposase
MSKALTFSLTQAQRELLQGLIHAGNAPARTQTRARILLLADRSQRTRRTDAQVSEAVLCSLATVGNIRRRFVRDGLEAALQDKPRPGAAPKITGDIEAHLVTLCCSDPPEGEARWTLRLLAGRVVELGLLGSLSHVAVGERLKKMNSSPGG